MTVRIRLFAQLRQRAGQSEVALDLPDGARVRDALAALGDLVAGLPVVMAINREYADEDAVLSAGRRAGADPAGVGRERPARGAARRAARHRGDRGAACATRGPAPS